MVRRATSLIASIGLALGFPTAEAGSTAEGQLSFNRDVRPILARHCFKCHGPDDKSRKAHLRLDRPDDALKAADSGMSPIVPGQPDESELVSRIFSEDQGELMPPPQAKLPVSERDRQILKRWIAEGAKYEVHWAFEKPVRPATPAVSDRGWPRNPIDAFVLARLGGGRVTAFARSRSGLADPPRDPRFAGAATDPRGGRSVRPGPFPGRLRASGGSPVRLAPIWRAMGTAMARPGALRRHERI